MYEAMNFGDDRNIPLPTTLILSRYKIQKLDLIGLGYGYSNHLGITLLKVLIGNNVLSV